MDESIRNIINLGMFLLLFSTDIRRFLQHQVKLSKNGKQTFLFKGLNDVQFIIYYINLKNLFHDFRLPDIIKHQKSSYYI